ncbi:MAG TPA: hypothetical protein PLT13_03275 [Spirochaetota bacterium]|nr:hypothetical protein [Spirochaetota bacterium]
MENEVIKRFAVDVLGCGCEDSVFSRIEQSRSFRLPSGITLASRILIGGRLLIYIADSNTVSPADLKSVVRDGLEERNSGGYNRLRVVIKTESPEEAHPRYLKSFNDISARDDKTHLHVLSRSVSL